MALIEGIKLELGNVFEGVGSLISTIREAITGDPSPDKKVKAEAALMQMQFTLNEGQQKINAIEAAHISVFVAGWRPFIGWVCGFGLGWNYIFQPLLYWVFSAFGKTITFPALDIGELITLLFALLGLAGLRTVEKKNDVAKSH